MHFFLMIALALGLINIGCDNQTKGNYSAPSTASDQWLTTGQDIYYDNGNVGIGTTSPKAPLQVGSSTVLQTNEADKNAHFAGNMYFDGTNWKFINNGGGGLMNVDTAAGTIGFYNAVAGTAGNNAALSPKMTILNNGNVGIGAVSPASTLQVAGTITAPQVVSPSGSDLIISSPAGKKVFIDGDNSTNGTVVLWDFVGINTITPVAGTSLDIGGTGIDKSSIIIPRDTVANRPTVGVNGMMRYATDTNKFEVFENGVWTNMVGVTAASSVNASAGTSASPSISFSGDSNTGFYSNGADTIGISANGANVFNISTTSISSPTTGGALITSGNGTVSAPTFSFAGDPDTGWWRPAADTMAASTAGAERMRISDLGTVSIGDIGTSKTLNFSIIGGGGAISTSSTWPMYLYPGNTLSVGLYNNRGVSIGATYASNNPPNDGLMVEGSVGIGLTNPGYKLDVNGDVNIAAANALRFGGTSVCTSAGCTAVSDVRLKENIQPLENSLEKILQLQGVEYDYRDKAKFGDKHQIGVIAQDTERIYPEVVVTDKKTGFKAVAYDHLVAPLIEAVKALYNRIVGIERDLASVKDQKADKTETDVLKADNEAKAKEIKDLKQENAEIKARLEKIEKALNSK